jgi:hypothetical protein
VNHPGLNTLGTLSAHWYSSRIAICPRRVVIIGWRQGRGTDHQSVRRPGRRAGLPGRLRRAAPCPAGARLQAWDVDPLGGNCLAGSEPDVDQLPEAQLIRADLVTHYMAKHGTVVRHGSPNPGPLFGGALSERGAGRTPTTLHTRGLGPLTGGWASTPVDTVAVRGP